MLSLALAGTALGDHAALAVDNITSTDAPDLASVRAKIKAKDFKAALAELTPMLTTYQHADVYNLMGFSLRKMGDTSRPIRSTARRSTSIPSTRARSNIWASSMSRPGRSTRRGRTSRC